MAMEVDAAGNNASLGELRDALSGTAGSSDLANTLDLSLVTDTKFRVAVVAAEPDGCDAFGHSLLDLASSPIRRELRESAERCVATGRSERIGFRLATAPDTEYAAALHAFDSAEGTCLILTGVKNVSGAALPGGIAFQLEVQRSVIDVMDVAVFWKDRESRFLGANEKMLEALGAETLDDVLGKDDRAFFPEETAAGYLADDEAVMSSGEPAIDIVERLPSPNGGFEVLTTSKLPVRDSQGEVIGVTGYFRIITDVVKAEQELRSLEGRHALALNASNQGLWEYDLEARQIEGNQRLIELIGHVPADGARFTQEQMTSIFGAEARREFGLRALELVEDPSLHMEFRSLKVETDTGTRWFAATGYPFVENGKVTRLIGSISDITQEVEREQALVHRANHDDLTGLANRRHLLERLDNDLQANEPIFLLYLDLDHFKVINDSLGHGVGDELLQAVSSRIAHVVPDSYLLARLGGDEFAVVGCAADQPAQELGEAILGAFSTPIALDDIEVFTSASIGVVYSTGGSTSAVGLMRDADIALYEAKAAGKSCVRAFAPEMRESADSELRLQNRIRHALKNEEFELVYQPIVSATSGMITGVEALLRWNTGSELVTPGVFLPYLEQSGLIVAVGEQVIEDSVAQLGKWIKDIPAAIGLIGSLNLSRVQFRSPQLVEVLLSALQRHEVPPSQVIVEVTETAIADDITHIAEKLNELRAAGVRVALDDFGVGQSSLSSLNDLPADILKIDGAFVERIDSSKPQPVIEAILTMAHSVGLTTTAEGVETAEQRAFLESAGCDYLQGYLLGRPMSPEQMAELLSSGP